MSIEHEIRDEMFYAFLERAGNGCLFLVRFLWGSHYYFFVDVVDERKVKNIMDVINRQAAIKDAESWVAVDEYEKHLQKNVVEWLKEFPSAEHGTDLISRAAAQTELQLSARRYTVAHEAHGEGRVVWSEDLISVSDAMDVLRKIPPAQPEIIRCKDCKHWMPYEWMFSEVWQSQNIDDYPEDEISCNYCDVHMKSSDFCSQAVRREVQDENDKTTNNTTNA